MPQAPKTLNTFEALNEIISALRGPGGCPWDIEQTHQSLVPYAIEETFEMAEAIESGDDKHMCEELGDVLFQVILHAAMAKERGAFDIFDVIQGINAKVVRRHPHVFADVKVSGSDEVLKNWDDIKKAEKKNAKPKGPIDVPPGLPALQRAHKIGEKTEKLKFDWAQTSQVLSQLKEEIHELEEVMSSKKSDVTELKHEMGDVLFSAAQLSRHLNIEPEAALRETNRRFVQRFEKMLELGSVAPSEFAALSSEKKENLWKQAKKALG